MKKIHDDMKDAILVKGNPVTKDDIIELKRNIAKGKKAFSVNSDVR